MSPHRLLPPRAAIFVISATLALAACQRSNAPAAAAGGAPGQVSVVTLQPQSVLLTRELPGRASASLVAEVRPQANGIVKRRLFTEGGTVKAGQPLYQLDDATYRADVASSEATLARAQATLETARLNARRSADLARIDAISRQDNENAAAALAQAEADLKAAQAALQRSTILLDYARITSPISGRIGKSAVTQGALVTANQANALATVQQLDPMYIDLTQSSSELLQLRQELAAGKLSAARDVPVQLLLEDGRRYPHDGKLAFSDVTVDPSTGSYYLRVTVPNPDNTLLPGMYLRAVVGSGRRDGALLVPQQGLTRDPKGDASVMVVNQDNKVEQRAVQVSRTIGDKWLVDGGLAAGDRVIVAGLQKVRAGMPVQATEAGADAAPAQGAAAPAQPGANAKAPAADAGAPQK